MTTGENICNNGGETKNSAGTVFFKLTTLEMEMSKSLGKGYHFEKMENKPP